MLRLRAAVVVGNARGRQLQRGDRLRVAGIGRSLELGLRDAQGRGREVEAIEPSGVVDEGGIDATAPPGKDRRQRGVDVGSRPSTAERRGGKEWGSTCRTRWCTTK